MGDKNRINYIVKGIDLSKFPKKLLLKYGRDGSREWWEFWHRQKGVVIQRCSDGYPYHIFFVDGDVVRVLEQEVPKDEKHRVIAVIPAFIKVDEAVKALNALGFRASLQPTLKSQHNTCLPRGMPPTYLFDEVGGLGLSPLLPHHEEGEEVGGCYGLEEQAWEQFSQ